MTDIAYVRFTDRSEKNESGKSDPDRSLAAISRVLYIPTYLARTDVFVRKPRLSMTDLTVFMEYDYPSYTNNGET